MQVSFALFVIFITVVALVNAGSYIVATGGQLPATGNDLNAAFVYNMDSKKWCQLPNLPMKWRSHASVEFNSKIYLIGGASGFFDQLAKVYSFDGTTYKREADLAHGRSDHSAIVVNGKIYVVAGQGQSSDDDTGKSVEIFDGTKWTNGPSLNQKRWRPALVNFRDQLLWALGGDYTSNGTSTEYLDLTQPGATWKVGPQLVNSRNGASAAVISEFVFIVCGGYDEKQKPTSSCDRFTSTTSQFYTSPSMTKVRGDFIMFPYPYDVVAFSTDVPVLEQFSAHDNKWNELAGYQIGQPTSWENAVLTYASNINVKC